MSLQPGAQLSSQKSLRRASHFQPVSSSSKGLPEMPRSTSNQSIARQMPISGPSSKPPRPSEPYAGDSSMSSNTTTPGHRPQGSTDRLRKQRGGPSIDSTRSVMDRRKSRVDGLLRQKRQSISYGSADAQGLMPGQPALPPPLPTGGDYSMAAAPSPKRDRTPAANLEDQLFSDDFDADAFLKQYMASGSGNTLDKLKRLKATLTTTHEANAIELQRSVLSNYSNFVTVSKELSSLENEMLELRSVLEEWRAVPDSLQLSTEPDLGLGSSSLGPTTGGSRRAHRNSIADLAALRRTQLEGLWETVEGSQKFLPPVPNRHLIADNPNFIELSSATYKPRGSVHLFLLNDAILVAVKRRRQMGSKMKLVADKCFILTDIVVVELKNNAEAKNAFKIRKGKETFVFASERLEDKKALLAAFKKVAEEMQSKKRRQSVWEAEHRKEIPGARSSVSGMPLPTTTFSPSKHFGFGKDDPSGKDLSWIGDVSDELVVRIALRDFESAVALVEKAREAIPLVHTDPTAAGLLRSKVDGRSSELSSALLDDLRAAGVAKSGVVRLCGWLMRLGEVDRARDVFLAGRAGLVKKRVKQIKFEGDIGAYISELAVVVFTLIKNTCEWYMAAFKDNKLASGFVQWAVEQVQLFSDMFKRQVYGADQDRQLIDEAMAVTQTHSLVLRDVGLDFSFQLSRLADGQ